MFVKPPGGGCANTTKSDPTIASMTRHPVRPIKPSETLLSNCRLDGEAYEMAKAFIDLIKIDRGKYYMFSVTDEKRANLYERIGKQIKGYTFQQADKWFYLYRI